ncbi:MAG: helix-hairpin-helix domain-containing protein [Tannerellaceae bacterium]|jgi:DNA uptake protein ComE-like DNA-binding protein|nr:helix-hairpin-helix domain-containing protein [Tannerellaceae bacterium]
MNWPDLLYFSKGERQALALLLLVIAAALLVLVVYDKKETGEAIAGNQYIVDPSNAPVRKEADSASHRSITREAEAHIPKPSPVTNQPKQTNQPKRGRSPSYTKAEKYPAGTLVELNTADTLVLKKVPGIGSAFARRIVKFRDLLGGFYTVSQLQEVYGMDDERYQALRPWFHADTLYIAKLSVNRLPYDVLIKHPYLNPTQTRTICRLRQQKGRLSGWENLQLLDEFSVADIDRLKAYLSFGD